MGGSARFGALTEPAAGDETLPLPAATEPEPVTPGSGAGDEGEATEPEPVAAAVAADATAPTFDARVRAAFVMAESSEGESVVEPDAPLVLPPAVIDLAVLYDPRPIVWSVSSVIGVRMFKRR